MTRLLFTGRLAWRSILTLAAALPALCGCNLAPDYQVPNYVLPSQWRGTPPFDIANPSETLLRGSWWERFEDPVLNGLEVRLSAQNPDLDAMYQQYVQSRDTAAVARSGLYPQLTVNGTSAYSQESRNRAFRAQNSGAPLIAGDNIIQAAGNWQPDFWQRIKNGEQQQARLAQSSAASFENARLSLQSQLATTYIGLRGADARSNIYARAVGEYETSVEINRLRLRGKIGSALDVARAQAQLSSTEALLSANQATRATLEHAIAILVGENPSTFSIASMPAISPRLPAIPLGIPSLLLERRPDIASAERQMAAANAAIGVARAAFYPNITLSASGGLEGTGVNLFSLPGALWAIGASAVSPLFEGGLRRAELQRSWSQFVQTRDIYRSTVLSAFQQVEDSLSSLASLKAQTSQQTEAVGAADAAAELTRRLYLGGITTYLDVVVAQETALIARLTSQQANTLQLQTAVNLISALGGGWDTDKLPTEKDVQPFGVLEPVSQSTISTP